MMNAMAIYRHGFPTAENDSVSIIGSQANTGNHKFIDKSFKDKRGPAVTGDLLCKALINRHTKKEDVWI
jgi:hypothetical protein